LNIYSETIIEDMIRNKVDGVIFYPIFTKVEDIESKKVAEYTTEEFKNVKGYPKCSYIFYKVINGVKNYIKFSTYSNKDGEKC